MLFDFPWDENNREFATTHALPETAGRVVMLEQGTSRIEIFEYRVPKPAPDIDGRRNVDLGICHFCFEVKDVDAEYERLSGAGMKMNSEPVSQANIRNFYGRDPDGNLIEIIEYFEEDAGI
ncbi:VOC family protein [Myxococcota bacterium]|nr:VOC family protein [Myxococcota bacterium]